MLVLALAMPSCTDWLDLRPQDGTIQEDFWKTQEDVESMVLACYRAMAEDDFMEHLLVAGEVRSDNAVVGEKTPEKLGRILDVTILSSNDYAKWADFYKVINYCNTVIKYAPEVVDADPNYTRGLLKAHLAEATTLRALAYFYLVRIWGDVPYIDFPYTEDTQNFKIAKSSGDSILNCLVPGLLEAETFALTARGGSTTDQRRQTKGRITKNATRALLADIYLWLGKYNECIEACERVLPDVLENLTDRNTETLTGAELILIGNTMFYNNAFQSIFTIGNSYESIFELQFNLDNSNSKVKEYYSSVVNTGFVSAAPFSNYNLFVADDLRGKDSFKEVDTKGFSGIFKYVGNERVSGTSTEGATSIYFYSDPDRVAPNWIFYRLPDIYLMMAEALVERSGGATADLTAALDLVNTTFVRSNPDNPVGFKFDDYNGVEKMRELVLDERQREFLFEGKRWFDLLRLARRDGSSANLLKYIIRKYTTNTAVIQIKLSNMDALYMPIHQNELTRNTALVQNKYYLENEN
ncbi:membrane protein [Bacteroidia bacterium]|nr:membrane protein [Bacteroidia bacterium]